MYDIPINLCNIDLFSLEKKRTHFVIVDLIILFKCESLNCIPFHRNSILQPALTL